MPDFTPDTYKRLLSTLLEHNFPFQPFVDFLRNPKSRSIILRHDVDARKMNSLRTAILENELGIRGTYYFRMVPESFDEKVIKQIYDLGHEIGYHYEEVSASALRLYGFKALRQKESADEIVIAETALNSFKENLEKFRWIVPVETICMHGSPLSRWDNRLLWKYYDYREFGIVGEPYFDIDFEKVLYLTDTGRRWNGVAVRDKPTRKEEMRGRGGDEGRGREEMMRGEGDEGRGREEVMRREGDEEKGRSKVSGPLRPHSPFPPLAPSLSNKFHSTFDIINAARENKLPDQIMLTVHPQRWDDRILPWISELIWQNIKNIGKWVLDKGAN